MTATAKETRAEYFVDAGLGGGDVEDYVALLKPRVMSLVVFTALVGMATAPSTLNPVLAVIALKPGSALEPQDLLGFLAPRMAHFMVPRYVRFVDALPRTETHKIQKYQLRQAGVAPGTWDRERAGIRLRQERVGAARANA